MHQPKSWWVEHLDAHFQQGEAARSRRECEWQCTGSHADIQLGREEASLSRKDSSGVRNLHEYANKIQRGSPDISRQTKSAGGKQWEEASCKRKDYNEDVKVQERDRDDESLKTSWRQPVHQRLGRALRSEDKTLTSRIVRGLLENGQRDAGTRR